MEYEQLVFFTQDPSSANPANIEADDGTQYEPSIGPDVEPVEVPVSKEGGEPLAEHRPHSFSVRRLRGFRQVVQHVQEHVAVGINWLIKSRKGRCCSGRKSKLVEDRYIILCTVTLIKETEQNTQNQTSKNKTKQKQNKNTKHKKNTNTQNQKQTIKNNTHQWAVTWQVQFMGEKDRLKQEVMA